MPEKLATVQARLRRWFALSTTAALVACLFGCTNPFADHYMPTRAQGAGAASAACSYHCAVIAATNKADAEEREKTLESDGYERIGVSSFETPELTDSSSQAQAHGKQVGADVVVLTSTDAGTRVTPVSIEYPQTPQERQECAVMPGKGAHTLLGTRIEGRCDRRITTWAVTTKWRRYYASYWRRHSQTSSVVQPAGTPKVPFQYDGDMAPDPRARSY